MLKLMNRMNKRMLNLKKRNKKQINGWKLAFILLLLTNAIFWIYIIINLQATPKVAPTDSLSKQTETSKAGLTAEVGLNQADLEEMLQHFLSHQEGTANLTIDVGDTVQLMGEWEVFGFTVDYGIQTEPFATEDGNLQLKVQSIELGAFSLPVSQFLGLLAGQLDPALPLEIDSENKNIYVTLTKIENEWINQLKLLQINKEKQEYMFEITIPRENLLQ